MSKYQEIKRLFTLASISGLALLLACSSDDDSNPQTKTTTEYSVDLTSTQVPVIPAVSSNASGSATLNLDKESGMLSGSFTLGNNITATAAHIHHGTVGATGAVVVALMQDVTNSQQFNVPENTVLMATQVTEMVNGEYYINVHTAANQSGELRGQILESDQSVLVTDLSVSQQPTLNQINSTGAARGFMVTGSTSGSVSGVVRLSNIMPTAMHIHSAYLGSSGGPVVTLAQSSDPAVWEIPASTMLTDSQQMDLNKGKHYFNIHTTTNTAGELQGQVKPGNIRFYVIKLIANQNVTSSAVGKAFITLDVESGLLNATVRTNGISITNMHIHDNNNSGAVVKALTATGDTSIWNVSDATLTSAEITSLNNGAYYINVHSAMYLAGELSGTIE